jgi:YggT family protein
MDAILNFIQFLLNGVLGLLIFVLIVVAILSWLVAFDVIKLHRNTPLTRIYYGLQNFIDPLLRPIRRVVPPLGGVDLSFLVLFLVIQGAQMFLIGPFFDFLRALV